MTPKEIDAMEAGRDMDALVAEKVMGCCTAIRDIPLAARMGLSQAWRCSCGYVADCPTERCGNCHRVAWLYTKYFSLAAGDSFSTDIAAAWQVVIHMRRVGDDDCYGRWAYGLEEVPVDDLQLVGASLLLDKPEKAPLLICRAALKAVLVPA